MDEYEQILYESLSFADTHPDRLAVLGRIFGLQPPTVENCRVLELGCGQGGNLIPMAWFMPNAQFLGIDLSPTQASQGAKNIAELGLTNIVIRQGNILELESELGEFDYIVAHGVLSWVESPVREKLLAVTRDLLSPHGLAYMSYNTNPGWRMRGVLRDMLLYHVRDCHDARQKLQYAQQLLKSVEPCFRGAEHPQIRYMAELIQRTTGEHPSYLYHEYLEPANQPMLFSEFAALAAHHGLKYLCDTELYTMFASSLGAQAEAFVDSFDGLLEQEQYLDFLRGRGFRQSVLCHEAVAPNYDIDISILEQFTVYADVIPQSRLDLRQKREEIFVTAGGEKFSVSESLSKAALQHLSEVYPAAITLGELRQYAQSQLPRSGHTQSTDIQSGRWLSELFNLFANGCIGLSTQSRRFSPPNFEMPLASALSRQQAKNGTSLTTVWHRNLELDPIALRLILSLDGTRRFDEIVDYIWSAVCSDAMDNSQENSSISAKGQWSRDTVRANCEYLLKLFARHGLLEAEVVQLHGHAA